MGTKKFLHKKPYSLFPSLSITAITAITVTALDSIHVNIIQALINSHFPKAVFGQENRLF